MTHLRIELNTITENITSNVIHKLYETAKAIIDAEEANEVQESLVSLKGNLYTTACYRSEKLYLESKFPDLHITTGDYIVKFEDTVVENKLLSLYGVDGIITESRAASISLPTAADMFKNTSAVSFNELPLFTNWRTIKTGMFYLVSTLREIDLSNVTGVDTGAFYGCTSLTNLGDTGNITWVAQNGFRGCTALSSIDTSNITYIGPYAFLECTGLTSVDLSAYTAGTAVSCFEGCTSLTSVTLPSTSFTWGNNIGNHKSVFLGCTSLASIDMSNATFIGLLYFQGCTALTTCIWPTSVTTIPQSCFLGCTNLTSVDLSNCTSIGNYAFYGCSSLATISGLSNVTTLGKNCFKGCSSLGSGQTLELNLTNQTSYPNDALTDTAFTRLILHSPLLSSSYDSRLPIYEGMRQLTYLDLSDWRPGASAFNAGWYGDSSFYNNNSLVTYIAPITTNYIGTAINNMGRYTNARYFILLNTTPPSIKTDDLNNPPSLWFYRTNGNVHIYVPDSAVSTYLNDSAWSTIGGYNGSDTISDRLHGLSELPAGVWTTGLASQYLTAALLATS